MRIRTRVGLCLLLCGLVFGIIAGLMGLIYRERARLGRQVAAARPLQNAAVELGYLANDYLIHQEPAQRERFTSLLSACSESLALLDPKGAEQRALADALAQTRERLAAVFAEAGASLGRPSASPAAAAGKPGLRLPANRLQILAQSLYFDAYRLAQLLREAADRLDRADDRLVLALMAFLVLSLLLNYLFVFRRASRSLSALREGAAILGTGDLDHRIEETQDDEFDDLARAFNRMAADLARVTASRTELEREMTDRRQAEEALRESEERFRTLVSASSELLYRMSPDWSEMRQLHSRGFLANTERPNRAWLQEYIPPVDQPRVVAAIREAMRTKSGFELEHRIWRADGGLGWAASRAVPLLAANGEIAEWFGAASDISERKRMEQAVRDSEEKYRRIVETAQEGILVADPQGTITFANAYMAQVLGYGLEELIGKPGLVLAAEREQAKGREKIGKRREGVREQYEIWMRRKDGSEVCLLVSGSPIQDAAGRHVGNLGMYTDLTARKAAEESLQRLNETLEQQVAERTAVAEQRATQLQALALQLGEVEEKERRRIAALLHDDLQQLLAASRFHLSVLPPVVKEAPHGLAVLQQVDRLLEQSIEKSRRLSHDLSPAILHQSGLPSALEWLAAQMLRQHGFSVQVETAAWTHLRDEHLRVFLYRAVQELLFNAVKHSGVRAAKVRLERNGEKVEVVVSDGGRGFEPRSLEEPGRPFKGFGLFSIRERAAYLGGSLEIESAPGQGSRFTLLLSLQGLDRPRKLVPFPPGPEATAPGAPGRAKEGARFRVVLADDHQVMRQGLVAVLENQPDIRVVGEAANGAEAVELAGRLRPDIVLMDVMMPVMDGIEATRQIKCALPAMRVIGLSMLGDEEAAERLKGAGAEAYLNKAVAAELLIAAIRGEGDGPASV